MVIWFLFWFIFWFFLVYDGLYRWFLGWLLVVKGERWSIGCIDWSKVESEEGLFEKGGFGEVFGGRSWFLLEWEVGIMGVCWEGEGEGVKGVNGRLIFVKLLFGCSCIILIVVFD